MSVFLVALAAVLTAQPAAAETYTVTSTACEGAGSITQAMQDARDAVDDGPLFDSTQP